MVADGKWLLLGWESADQWLFIRSADVDRVLSVPNVSAQFEGGGQDEVGFPHVAGWCCSDLAP